MVTKFGVSFPPEALQEIDELVAQKNAVFSSRSHALLRIFQEWKEFRAQRVSGTSPAPQSSIKEAA
jgi:metal-responsive CopG/Arc/MetJ family transcriptional regulator